MAIARHTICVPCPVRVAGNVGRLESGRIGLRVGALVRSARQSEEIKKDHPSGGKSLIPIAEHSHFTSQIASGATTGFRSTFLP